MPFNVQPCDKIHFIALRAFFLPGTLTIFTGESYRGHVVQSSQSSGLQPGWGRERSKPPEWNA
ncbi:MAG: hypothetical protein WBW76_14555 [Candidatus Cybelea sp.]